VSQPGGLTTMEGSPSNAQPIYARSATAAPISGGAAGASPMLLILTDAGGAAGDEGRQSRLQLHPAAASLAEES
jgi:hypothetical protein